MCGGEVIPPDMPAALRPRHGEAWDDKKKKKEKRGAHSEDWEAAFQEFMAADDDGGSGILAGLLRPGPVAMATPSSRLAAEPGVVAEPERPQRRRPRRRYQYHGIRQRPWGRWSSEIRDPIKGIRLWLGTFDTAAEAAYAYDAEARRIHGHKARTNFPLAHPAPAMAPVPVPSIYHHGTTHRLDAPPPLCFLLNEYGLITLREAPSYGDSSAASTSLSSEASGDAHILLECSSDDVMDTNFPLAHPAPAMAPVPVPSIYHHGTTHRIDAPPPLCFLLNDDGLINLREAPNDGDSSAASTSPSSEASGDAHILLECCSDDVMDNLLAGFDVASSDMDKDNWSLHLC